jgi:hypothetical protein
MRMARSAFRALPGASARGSDTSSLSTVASWHRRTRQRALCSQVTHFIAVDALERSIRIGDPRLGESLHRTIRWSLRCWPPEVEACAARATMAVDRDNRSAPKKCTAADCQTRVARGPWHRQAIFGRWTGQQARGQQNARPYRRRSAYCARKNAVTT